MFLDDLHGLRRKTFRQLMQAIAAQHGHGALDRLDDDKIDRLTREVETYAMRFAVVARDTAGELSPQSRFEYLIADLLALDEFVDRTEHEIADTGYDHSSIVC